MKAPDKIYISHHYKQPIDYGFFKTENAEPYTVEYIRKEAVLALVDKLSDEAPSYDDSRVYLDRAFVQINSL